MYEEDKDIDNVRKNCIINIFEIKAFYEYISREISTRFAKKLFST